MVAIFSVQIHEDSISFYLYKTVFSLCIDTAQFFVKFACHLMAFSFKHSISIACIYKYNLLL
jgi:hypothetical protein